MEAQRKIACASWRATRVPCELQSSMHSKSEGSQPMEHSATSEQDRVPSRGTQRRLIHSSFGLHSAQGSEGPSIHAASSAPQLRKRQFSSLQPLTSAHINTASTRSIVSGVAMEPQRLKQILSFGGQAIAHSATSRQVRLPVGRQMPFSQNSPSLHPGRQSVG